uniref:DUF6534 domain-containing protein n=1 Tax=Mycena chlorophos TaxID=658473 RepID=A0ABQ0LJM8_MYCCL|nr:predicted protein [Mycena chlorophos]
MSLNATTVSAGLNGTTPGFNHTTSGSNSTTPGFHHHGPPRGAFTLTNTLGVTIIGFAVACVLYGVLLSQASIYFRRFSMDSLVYRILVGVVVLLCTGDLAMIGHFTYFFSLGSVGNPFAILESSTTWSIILQQTFSSLIGAVVKCAFATRVYRFSERNPFITGLIILLALGQLAVSLIFTIDAFSLSSIPAVFRLRTLATISIGLGVGTDVVIAAALCFFLNRLRTGYKPADSLVKRLVLDAVNTGVVTSAVSLATLLLFDFNSGNLIFLTTFFQLDKLYAISFLATLNTRRNAAGRGTDAESGAEDDEATGYPGLPQMRSGGSRPSRRAQEETNMFALGTRVPSFHETEMPAYEYPFSLEAKVGVGSSDRDSASYAKGYAF